MTGSLLFFNITTIFYLVRDDSIYIHNAYIPCLWEVCRLKFRLRDAWYRLVTIWYRLVTLGILPLCWSLPSPGSHLDQESCLVDWARPHEIFYKIVFLKGNVKRKLTLLRLSFYKHHLLSVASAALPKCCFMSDNWVSCGRPSESNPLTSANLWQASTAFWNGKWPKDTEKCLDCHASTFWGARDAKETQLQICIMSSTSCRLVTKSY